MKLVIVFLAVALALVSGASLFAGERETKDTLVCYGKIYMSARPNRTSSIRHRCPVLGGRNITYVLAEDAMEDSGNGGTAEIVEGGVGYTNVTLNFTSQLGQALDYTIKVYAQQTAW